MSTAQAALRWLGIGSGLVALLSFGVLFLLCCGGVPSNQLKLWRLWRRYQAVSHPPGSAVLQTYAEVGLLEGNGNHCDVIAGEQRRSDLSADELRSFYASTPALHLQFSGDGGSYVSDRTDAWPPGSYAVYLFEWGHDADFDIRCH